MKDREVGPWLMQGGYRLARDDGCLKGRMGCPHIWSCVWQTQREWNTLSNAARLPDLWWAEEVGHQKDSVASDLARPSTQHRLFAILIKLAQ